MGNENELWDAAPIRTNEVSFSFDYEELKKEYEVFLISSDAKIHFGSWILDSQCLCSNICSLVRRNEERGEVKNVYLLMKPDPSNLHSLKEALKGLEDYDQVWIQKEPLSSVPPYLMAQLLLNSLGTYTGDLKVSNLTGSLYCYVPGWLERRKDGFIRKVKTLEMRFTRDNTLSLQVRTFTNVKLRNSISFTEKRPFEDYPQYVFSKNTLRRKLKGDTEDCFILKQTTGARSSIPFLDISSLKKFQACKLGVLQEMMTIFQRKFKGKATLEFKTVSNYISTDVRSSHSMLLENKSVIQDCFSRRQLCIVDEIQNDESKVWCEKFSYLLAQEYAVNAKIVREVNTRALNIRLIHNRDYYEEQGLPDPHDQIPEGAVVQHATLEDSPASEKSIVRAIVLNMLIKEDLNKGKISLFDWSSLGLDGNMVFLYSPVRRKRDEDRRYFSMEIAPDGSFSFLKEWDSSSQEKYQDCLEIFDEDRKNEVQEIIVFPDGNVNLIRDTSIITLPELDLLESRLKAKDKQLRNREARDTMLTSLLDIKAYERDEKVYYFSGVIGAGMQTKVAKAVHVRELEAVKGSTHFDLVAPLLNVPFVTNGRLTVIPFPFKYLREHVAAETAGESGTDNA